MKFDSMKELSRSNSRNLPLTRAEEKELAAELKKEAALQWINYECKIHGVYSFREDRKPRCRKCVEKSRFTRTPKADPAVKPETVEVAEKVVLPYHEVKITGIKIGEKKIDDIIRVDKALTKGDDATAKSVAYEWLKKQYGSLKNVTDLVIRIV